MQNSRTQNTLTLGVMGFGICAVFLGVGAFGCGEKTYGIDMQVTASCDDGTMTQVALIRVSVVDNTFQTIHTETFSRQADTGTISPTLNVGARYRFELEGLDELEGVVARGASRWTTMTGGDMDLCVFLGELGWFQLVNDCQCGEVQLPFNLAGHTVTPLPDGRVLITGGATVDETGGILDISQEVFIFDPNTSRLRQLPAGMRIRRAYHTATLLKADNSPDQQQYVLVSGGMTLINRVEIQSSSVAEIFDPRTETFSVRLLQMQRARFGHTATLLTLGHVLVTGGAEVATGQTLDPEHPPLMEELPLERVHNNADLFEFNSHQVIASNFAGSPVLMADPRIFHAAARGSGFVLVSGGEDNAGNVLNTTEVYDPNSNSFVAGTQMTLRRSWHSATDLETGNIVVAGGVTSFRNPSTATGRVEIFDLSNGPPGTTQEYSESTLLTPRWRHTATRLLDMNTVLVIGGLGVHGYTLDAAELVVPGSSTQPTDTASVAERVGHAAARLPGGSVLAVGGMSVLSLGGVEPQDTLEIFTPRRQTD